MIDFVGLDKGIDTQFNDKSVDVFIKSGGIYEDEPDAGRWFSWGTEKIYHRYTNHFHDPTKAIGDAGFDGYLMGTLFKGESAILWSQKAAGTQDDGGNYSWQDARSYYYDALTSLDPDVRETMFAKTFRSLGQVMHIMQDMSSPAHTRNDGHYFYNFETRLKNLESSTRMAEWIAAGSNHPYPMAELNQPGSFAEAPVPISRLFDGNPEHNSDSAVTLKPTTGLAEFTNANFVSADTLPNDDTGTTPNLKETCVGQEERLLTNLFGMETMIVRPYHTRTLGCTTGGDKYLLAGVNFVDFVIADAIDILGEPQTMKIPPMDDNVYDDYARLLIPRAVGYSASLLKYFFRGELQATGHDILDVLGNRLALQFTVENLTPFESVENGEFVVAYQYQPADGEAPVFRLSPPVGAGQIAADGGQSTYLVILDEPIAVDAAEVGYQLIYRGRLGYEDDAVIAGPLTILQPVFEENWSQGLTGSNPWQHSGVDLPTVPAEQGKVVNQADSALWKQNVRYSGYKSAQVNESLVNPVNPVTVSADAMIGLKIDDMEFVPVLGPQQCAENPWELPEYQKVRFRFRMGDGTLRTFHYSVDGHHDYGNRLSLNEGYHWYDNIHWVLNQLGPVIEPVQLLDVSIIQQLLPLCDDIATDQTQSMLVDYIRVLDR